MSKICAHGYSPAGLRKICSQSIAPASTGCRWEYNAARGAKRAMPLPVSAPFHSSLMQPAADKLKGRLVTVTLSPPQCALINNVDVKVERDSARIKDALVRQAASPVRWVETIRAMVAMGATHIVECGPGKVLAGMTQRIAPQVQSLSLSDRASLEAALAARKG